MRKRSAAVLWVAVLALGPVGCARSGAEKPQGAVPTPEGGAQPTEAELATRRDRIRAHFSERAKRRQVVATTVTKAGQTIDWIRPESQVAEGRLAEAPPAVAAAYKETAGQPANPYLGVRVPLKWVDLQGHSDLELEESARGPKGTVPIVRFDVEKYLAEEKLPPRDPGEVLVKIPPPSPASNDRYYAVWQRFGTFFGSAGRINVWDTSGPVGNETSIAQTALIRGTPMQAIEAGKIEVQSLNGNRGPHFFTYYRTNGSASGDWVGGYNTLVDGWIQVSPSVAPGMSIAGWNSQTGGNQFSLDVEVRIHQGNWWVWAAGQWAGYYPNCRGGDAPPCDSATLFSANGIRDQVDRLDWYGEVFDSSAPRATSTDMGSGTLAGGWQQAAYFRNITFYWAPTTYWWWDSGSVSTTDAACYNASGPFYSSDPSWRNWFFYGGPGKENTGCN